MTAQIASALSYALPETQCLSARKPRGRQGDERPSGESDESRDERGSSYFETARRAATQVYDALPSVALSTLPVALSASASSLTAMVPSIPTPNLNLSALSPTRCLSRSHSDPELGRQSPVVRHAPGAGQPSAVRLPAKPLELLPKGSVLSVGTFALEAALAAAGGRELPLMALLQGFDVGTGKVLGAMGPALALVVKGLSDNIAKVLAACAKAQAQVPPQPCETVREVLVYELGRKLHVQGTPDKSAKLAESSAAMGLLWLRRTLEFTIELLGGLAAAGESAQSFRALAARQQQQQRRRPKAQQPPPPPSQPQSHSQQAQQVDMVQVTRAAYHASLARYHGYALQLTFEAAAVVVPKYPEMLCAVAAPTASQASPADVEATVAREIVPYLRAARALVAQLEVPFAELRLEHTAPV